VAMKKSLSRQQKSLFYDVPVHFCLSGSHFFPATLAKNQQRGVKQNSSTLQLSIFFKKVTGGKIKLAYFTGSKDLLTL
jgi:hypothetical protein